MGASERPRSAGSLLLEYEAENAEEPAVPCILFLDSIKGHHNCSKYAAQVRKYCQLMYEHLYAPAEYTQHAEEARKQGLPRNDPKAPELFLQDPRRLPHARLPNAPQQPNSCDCGAFTVQFCRQWILRALGPHITARVLRDRFKGSMFLGADMFDTRTIPELRQTLARSATELAMDKIDRVDRVDARRLQLLATREEGAASGAGGDGGGRVGSSRGGQGAGAAGRRRLRSRRRRTGGAR